MTNCDEIKKDAAGMRQLADRLVGEINTSHPLRLREPGRCHCCGSVLKVAVRVFDMAGEAPTMYELGPGDKTSLERLSAAIEKGEKVGTMPRLWAFYEYHCPSLLDKWFWETHSNEKISPMDIAERIVTERKKELAAAVGPAARERGGMGAL